MPSHLEATYRRTSLLASSRPAKRDERSKTEDRRKDESTDSRPTREPARVFFFRYPTLLDKASRSVGPWTFPLRCGASLGDRHLLQTVPAPLQSKVPCGFVRTTVGRATWSMQPNPYVVSHNNTLTSEVRLYIHTPERLVKVRSAMSLYVHSYSVVLMALAQYLKYQDYKLR